jgi:hypothetical protein
MESELFFLFYLGVLLLSGVLMLVIAGVGLGASAGARVLNAVLGLAALGYGIYLITTVFINGGSYRIFIYAFILPVIAIVQLVKGLKARASERAQQSAMVGQMAPQGYQMPPQGQAPQGQQTPPAAGYQEPQAPRG